MLLIFQVTKAFNFPKDIVVKSLIIPIIWKIKKQGLPLM